MVKKDALHPSAVGLFLYSSVLVNGLECDVSQDWFVPVDKVR